MSHSLVLSHLDQLQTLPLLHDASPRHASQTTWRGYQVRGLSDMSGVGTRRKQGPSLCLGLAGQR